ncbi:response regulator [Actinoplanes flavus]|uniref:Response regulator n=1 Tax=Actinoplanes flavus TaxID=2820290 RepID=A0ABS3UIP4_9ACTN|nr:response regulator [Actinoplanes flavus]MBO3738635.1 response regulator [Actinoplanes flavus]
MARIVVAEDESDILAVMQRLLARAGHEVIQATDGAAGWEAVQRHHPDLVVSDINMPVVSGTELCALIRSHAETRGIPVIFVSGNLIPGDTRPLEQATAVLSKPFLPRDLLACVEKVLQTGHTEGGEPTICP